MQASPHQAPVNVPDISQSPAAAGLVKGASRRDLVGAIPWAQAEGRPESGCLNLGLTLELSS